MYEDGDSFLQDLYSVFMWPAFAAVVAMILFAVIYPVTKFVIANSAMGVVSREYIFVETFSGHGGQSPEQQAKMN